LKISYGGLSLAKDDAAPHLGGNIKSGDPYTYSPAVWNYVISRFSIKSVLDVGSGAGNASYFFHKAGLQVIAVDGLAENIEKSFYPAVLHDLTKGPLKTVVDLVHCQEVVEHIEEQFIDNLMDTLICGRIVLISHAVPGQGGYHHVNLQPSSYWVEQFAKRGCSLLAADSVRIQTLAEAEGAVYLARSGLVFSNEKRC
jgi:SAM-dependent methyltransferase